MNEDTGISDSAGWDKLLRSLACLVSGVKKSLT